MYMHVSYGCTRYFSKDCYIMPALVLIIIIRLYQDEFMKNFESSSAFQPLKFQDPCHS